MLFEPHISFFPDLGTVVILQLRFVDVAMQRNPWKFSPKQTILRSIVKKCCESALLLELKARRIFDPKKTVCLCAVPKAMAPVPWQRGDVGSICAEHLEQLN